ncbi:MAG TPA: hypothetical protein VIF34_04485 [Methylocystis sp.]|jgi:hypothetical protein
MLKKEIVDEAAWARIGDRIVAQRVERGEGQVKKDEDRCSRAEEGRPARGHRVMVQVDPETAL